MVQHILDVIRTIFSSFFRIFVLYWTRHNVGISTLLPCHSRDALSKSVYHIFILINRTNLIESEFS